MRDPNRLFFLLAFAALLLIATFSCKKTSPGEISKNTLSAKTDGKPFNAPWDHIIISWANGKSFGINGSAGNDGDWMLIELAGDTIGEYLIDPVNQPGNLALFSYSNNNQSYETQFGGKGKITIETRTDSTISGTFSFIAASDIVNPSEKVEVTDGVFNVVTRLHPQQQLGIKNVVTAWK